MRNPKFVENGHFTSRTKYVSFVTTMLYRPSNETVSDCYCSREGINITRTRHSVIQVSKKKLYLFQRFCCLVGAILKMLCPRERWVFQSKLGVSSSNQCNLHHSPHTGHLKKKVFNLFRTPCIIRTLARFGHLKSWILSEYLSAALLMHVSINLLAPE